MKEERTRKNINCVSCKKIFICKGALNPDMCINYEKRENGEKCEIIKENTSKNLP